MNKNIIPAVRNEADFSLALKTESKVIFVLKTDILSVDRLIKRKGDKKIFVHIDMADGIGKDKKGVEFLKNAGVDGIISTKNHIITVAKDMGLKTVQRFFIIDSASVKTAMDTILTANPDYAEIMPGVIPKLIKKFVSESGVNVIAGGLVENKEEIEDAINAGAKAVSVGNKNLW